jgi:sulfatase modifying factor 1
MKESSDPKVRSTRGGSFMFDQAGDKSFTTTFRGKNSIDTSLFNTGFRCAK